MQFLQLWDWPVERSVVASVTGPQSPKSWSSPVVRRQFVSGSHPHALFSSKSQVIPVKMGDGVVLDREGDELLVVGDAPHLPVSRSTSSSNMNTDTKADEALY